MDIGNASGVLPDALATAFDIVKTDTTAHNASLIINEIPIGGHCIGCDKDFTADEVFIFACPNCDGRDFMLTSGRELDIKEIEVD